MAHGLCGFAPKCVYCNCIAGKLYRLHLYRMRGAVRRAERRSWLCSLLLSLLIAQSLMSQTTGSLPVRNTGEQKTGMVWTKLPPVPGKLGLAGPMAGVQGSWLIVGGGANFPDGPPWKDGKKKWHSTIYALDSKANTEWIVAGELAEPLAYCVTLTLPDGLNVRPGILCCGGSNESSHRDKCFVARFENSKLELEFLPSLPQPCANACGVLLDGVVYIAGGTLSPSSTSAMNTFWALDLKEKKSNWKELPTIPGSGRMLAVMAAFEKSIYLFSGATLQPGSDGKPVRSYLRDCYRFDLTHEWKRMADMPRPAVAAPSPAITHERQIIILGGDDGSRLNFQPVEAHPGFPKTWLEYSPELNIWNERSDLPMANVTTTIVPLGNKFIIPNGETRPGVRTAEVWQLELVPVN